MMSVYRGYDIRSNVCRDETGITVHDLRGDLLFRCATEEQAKEKINRLVDSPNPRRIV